MPDAHEFLRSLTVILAVAAVTTVLFQRLRQPVVLGYIIAGLIVGPHVPIPLVANRRRADALRAGRDPVGVLARPRCVLPLSAAGVTRRRSRARPARRPACRGSARTAVLSPPPARSGATSPPDPNRRPFERSSSRSRGDTAPRRWPRGRSPRRRSRPAGSRWSRAPWRTRSDRAPAVRGRVRRPPGSRTRRWRAGSHPTGEWTGRRGTDLKAIPLSSPPPSR